VLSTQKYQLHLKPFTMFYPSPQNLFKSKQPLRDSRTPYWLKTSPAFKNSIDILPHYYPKLRHFGSTFTWSHLFLLRRSHSTSNTMPLSQVSLPLNPTSRRQPMGKQFITLINHRFERTLCSNSTSQVASYHLSLTSHCKSVTLSI